MTTCRKLVIRRGHVVRGCEHQVNQGYDQQGPYWGLCTQHAEEVRRVKTPTWAQRAARQLAALQKAAVR